MITYLFRIAITEFARPEEESTRQTFVSVTTGGGGKAVTSAVHTGTVQIRLWIFTNDVTQFWRIFHPLFPLSRISLLNPSLNP